MKITKDTKIFAIGSCFALEAQRQLTAKGYNVLNYAVERAPDEPALIWYNTHTIAYEFARVAGTFTQAEDDVWQIEQGWQDPYRRLVFAPTKEALWQRITRLDTEIGRCIRTADMFIITLGLTEVFFMPNGNAICATPGYGKGGGEGCRFAVVEFEDNLANMHRVMSVIAGRPLVLTVSPVPLVRTFTGSTAEVANRESKSILRAVAGRLTRQFSNVHYLPSYEMSLVNPVSIYKEDKRHVTPAFVSSVIAEFERTFC